MKEYVPDIYMREEIVDCVRMGLLRNLSSALLWYPGCHISTRCSAALS